MSRTTRNTNTNTITDEMNMTREELHGMVINKEERDEFGFQVFQNPYTQAPFERAQREYKLKYNLKTAYDNQEFLRKMRADIKREYLTRKKQLKKLQQDAAVRFREDEMKLQEHYSTEFAKSQPRREINIQAPIISHVTLPDGECLNLKEFNIEQAFDGLCRLHQEYFQTDMEVAIQQVHEERERQEQQQQDPRKISWVEWVVSNESDNDDTDYCDVWVASNDDNDDTDYCDVFGYYPCENEWERQASSDAAEEEAAEEDAAEEEACRKREEEMSIEAEEDAEPTTYTYTYDDDIPVVEPKERHASNATTITASSTNVISAKKRAVSKSNAAAATKARIAKEEQKKQQAKKFVPIKITINDNRERHAKNQDVEANAILSASKIEINLPKKNLQGASREVIKRHNQKWNRVNALAKQSGARGTRIENLRDPRPCYNNSSWFGNESD